MHLNKHMENFYLSILDYAGLDVDSEHNIVQKNENMGPFTLDDHPLALPYFELMKNPGERRFFHLLHENYASPETVLFNLFKRRLTLEINLRTQQLMVSLIAVAAEPKLQKRVKSRELIDLITNIGEVDHSVIEPILKMCVASKKENDVGYVLDFYLKKNGKVGDTPYAAIGKINHKLYREASKALEEGPGGDYRVYGSKFRKKDLVAVTSVLEAIFPSIQDEASLIDGTDNKIFRYLNILLKVSYIVTSRLNEIVELLKEVKDESLCLDEIESNHEWVNELETLYGMAEEIRLIPNQTDIRIEAKKLAVDESRAKVTQQPTPQPTPQPQSAPQAPTFNPQMVSQPQQVQQPQAPVELSPEDVIRGRMNQQQQYMQPQMVQPQMMMQPQQAPLPGWMQREVMQQQSQNQPQYQQPMMQQQGYIQPMMQQQGYVQPMMQPQFQQQPMQMQGQWGQPQMQLNPQMMQRTAAPWQ